MIDLEKWSYSFLQKIGKRLKVNPQFIPYEDQLLGSNFKKESTTLSNYLSDMRNYTRKLKEWIETNQQKQEQKQKQEEDVSKILSRFGGIRNSFSLPLPQYIFDNKVIFICIFIYLFISLFIYLFNRYYLPMIQLVVC